MRVIPLVLLLLAGCASEPQRVVVRESVEVPIPVPVACAAPAELREPLAYELPEFVAPTDSAATSGLTAEGEKRLQRMLWALRQRVAAWEAWAAAQDEH